MAAFSDEFWESAGGESARSLFETMLRQTIEDGINSGMRIISNGDYSISYLPDAKGEDPGIALRRVKSIIDRLHDKFPVTAKRLSFIISNHSINIKDNSDDSVAGATRLSRPEDHSNTIMLREKYVNNDAPISTASSPGWFQTKDYSITMSEWTIIHEWGHAHDRHLITPEPAEMFERWSRRASIPGLNYSRYARYSREEAYAEAFADWITSGGQTTNPATRAYAEFYQWETP